MTQRLVLTKGRKPASMGDAIKALRGEDGHTHDANATHRRIIGTVTQKKRQRRQLVATILIVFVGFPLGTTAYAAFFGAPAFVEAWFDLTPQHSVTNDRPLSARGEGKQIPRRTLRSEAPDVGLTPHHGLTVEAPVSTSGEGKSVPSEVLRGEVQETGSGEAKRARSETLRREVRPQQILQREAAPTITPDPSQALYARAHELHFTTRDPAAALNAWNAYLTNAPNAPLAPEAKYNRALCLVRLRRNGEAIEALTPFANGTGYRKRDATRLLQALTP